jgi:hypothetical protein
MTLPALKAKLDPRVISGVTYLQKTKNREDEKGEEEDFKRCFFLDFCRKPKGRRTFGLICLCG